MKASAPIDFSQPWHTKQSSCHVEPPYSNILDPVRETDAFIAVFFFCSLGTSLTSALLCCNDTLLWDVTLRESRTDPEGWFSATAKPVLTEQSCNVQFIPQQNNPTIYHKVMHLLAYVAAQHPNTALYLCFSFKHFMSSLQNMSCRDARFAAEAVTAMKLDVRSF